MTITNSLIFIKPIFFLLKSQLNIKYNYLKISNLITHIKYIEIYFLKYQKLTKYNK